jgi:hypothetical protein
MAFRRLIANGLLGAVLLAGCGTQVLPEARVIVDGVPSGECVMHPTPGPGPFLLCPVAVDLAVNKLTVVPGTVSAVEFHLGALCPPNARCRLVTDQGAVVFWFVGSPPLVVPVTHEAGGYVAWEPEAPPQWLVDQGPAAELPAP